MAGRRRLSAALAAAVTASLSVAAPPAAAHRTHPTVVARLDRVEPPLTGGAVVEVRAGIADQLVVVNDGHDPVEVLDARGAPFIRVSHATVEADLGNPAWAQSLLPFPAPPRAPSTRGWTVVALQGSWAWFDHRLHDVDRPDDLTRDSRSPIRLGEWSVPLRHRGRTHVVHGHVEARPVLGQFRSRVTRTPEGAEVDVLDGRVPGLFVRWKGTGTMLVRGVESERFARFTPGGVEVDQHSATWRADRALRGETVENGVTERWVSQGTTPSLTWLDRRLAYGPGVPPEDALRRARPTTLVRWFIPVEGPRGGVIAGETVWYPNDVETGNGTRTVAVAAAVAGLAVVAVTVLARGRRRRRVEQ